MQFVVGDDCQSRDVELMGMKLSVKIGESVVCKTKAESSILLVRFLRRM